MVVMICVSIVVIPTQASKTWILNVFVHIIDFFIINKVEQLVSLWVERQNLGASYSNYIRI